MAQDKDPRTPDPRRMFAIGFLVVAVLLAGILLLFHALHDASNTQDCVMQGRSNCAPVDDSTADR